MSARPATMRAYRVPGWGRPAGFEEVPVPEPGPGQVLVRVAGTGLCHSDLGMQQMPEETCVAMGWQVPFTLGHETGGHVAAIGAGVTTVAVGTPVALTSPSPCGDCSYCRAGSDNNCPHGTAGRGYGRDGGLAPYVLVESERWLVPLRTLDPTTVGPLTDAGTTAMHAVRRVLPRLGPSSTAVVIGAGGLGSFAVQLLRVLSPATVVAVDLHPARLDVARDLGAHEAVIGVDDATTEHLRGLSYDGLGVDAVLDFAGFDDTIRAGTAAVRPGGSYGLVGAGFGTLSAPWYSSLPRDGEVFTFQAGTIADTLEVIRLAEEGRIRNEVDLFSFDQVAEAYERLHAGTLRGRAVITM